MKIFLTTIGLAIQAIAFSQVKDTVFLTPGSKLLQTDQLKDYTVSYDFFRVKDGAETKVGSIDADFKIINHNQTTYGLLISHIVFGENKILDSGVCMLNSLAPVSLRSHQTKRTLYTDFGHDVVTGSYIKLDENNATEVINQKVSIPLFDSYYEDMIAKAIQFKEGLVFKFAEYIYERGGAIWSSGEVKGKTMVQDKTNKSIPAWTIVFYERGSKGEITRTTTFLIAESDRKIITREYKVGENRILLKEHI